MFKESQSFSHCVAHSFHSINVNYTWLLSSYVIDEELDIGKNNEKWNCL